MARLQAFQSFLKSLDNPSYHGLLFPMSFLELAQHFLGRMLRMHYKRQEFVLSEHLNSGRVNAYVAYILVTLLLVLLIMGVA